jgi:RNA polymerase sigma-70 factor (ECF subfamily)
MYTDQELVQHISQNSEKHIRYFIKKYQNYLYTICISVLRNKEEAEEATQDSFLKVFKALPTYTPNGKLTTWMYTVAYRTSLDYLKKRKHTEEISPESGGTYEFGAELLNKERDHELSLLINKLPPEEAGLIRLFYLEEQSIKEIAKELDYSESNVKVKLYRARKALYAEAKKVDYFSDFKVKT